LLVEFSPASGAFRQSKIDRSADSRFSIDCYDRFISVEVPVDPISTLVLGAIGSLIVGVILLYLEHRTGWFANHFPKPHIQTEQFVSEDWAETIAKVKEGLTKIYSVEVSDIDVKAWNKIERNQKIVMDVAVHHGRNDNRHYIVFAHRNGGIIESRSRTIEDYGKWGVGDF
jgi:hypothetical protein